LASAVSFAAARSVTVTALSFSSGGSSSIVPFSTDSPAANSWLVAVTPS